MTAGPSNTILPICKPTSRVQIWEGKQSIIYYFTQNIYIVNRARKKEYVLLIKGSLALLFKLFKIFLQEILKVVQHRHI
jgi:hypothetical protein